MTDAIVRNDAPEQLLGSASERTAGNGSEPGADPARPPLGSLLTRAGIITDDQLQDALREGVRTGARVGEVVVGRGWVTEDHIAKLLAEQWQLGYVERASIWFDADALARMSRDQAQRLEALPTRVQDGHVVVAVAEPTEQRLAALREVIGEDTVVVVVPKSALDAGLKSELLAGGHGQSGAGASQRPPEPKQPEPEPKEPEPQEPEPQEPEPQEPEPPAFQAPVHSTETAAPPPVRVVARAVTEPPPAPSSDSNGEHDLVRVLDRLQEAAGEAAVLQRGVAGLATRLEHLAADLAAVAEQLDQSSSSREADRSRIHRLEEQLGQRTELTERLKAQLGDLARTLENLD